MKWILYVLLALAAALAAATAFGAALPQSHIATRRARFRQTADALFAAISVKPESPYEIVESTPPRRLVTRIADKSLPYGGTWTYEIVPVGDGAILLITEHGEVYNPFFRFMSRYVFGHTRTIETYLKQLAAKFGEPVRIEE